MLMVFQKSLKGVLTKIQGVFKSGSIGFQESFKVVSWLMMEIISAGICTFFINKCYPFFIYTIGIINFLGRQLF